MHEREIIAGVVSEIAHAFMIQTAHAAIPNARATTAERLARRILMALIASTAKRCRRPRVSGLMLGVRRAGVTKSAEQIAESTVQVEQGDRQVFLFIPMLP